MRAALSVFDGRGDASKVIRCYLRESRSWKEAKVIYGFSPLAHEPDWLGSDWPQEKILAFPRIQGSEMAFFTAAGPAGLLSGTHGILEPGEKSPAPPPNLILVPGLAFDQKGGRLGRNRGYYDRFLEKHPSAATIGIGFSWQLVPAVPVEPHDIRLASVLTDEGFSAP